MARGQHDRKSVIDAAASIADRRGLENVTLAAIADKLGIRSPSLFNHVEGLQDVRRELGLRGMEQLAEALREVAVDDPGESLVAMAHGYRAYARKHGGLYEAAMNIPDPRDEHWLERGRDLSSVMIRPIEELGLATDKAMHAARTFRIMLHGFVSLEAAGAYWMPVDLEESFAIAIEAYVASLRAGMHGKTRRAKKPQKKR